MTDLSMTSRSQIICFIGLLTAAFLFSGCVFLDRLKQSLSPPEIQDQQIEIQGQEPESTLLTDVLHFAGQIHHMQDQNRKKIATFLRHKTQKTASTRDNMSLALLALYVDEETLPTSEALAALQHVKEAESGKDLKLLGLVDVLRQALLEIVQERKNGEALAENLRQKNKELAEKLQASENKDSLQAELAAEKKKNEEMSQKLQKLLEIEKIVEKRK